MAVHVLQHNEIKKHLFPTPWVYYKLHTKRKEKGVWGGSTDSGPAVERFLPNTNSIEMIKPNTKNSYWAKSIWLVEKVNTYLSENAWANGSLSAIEN